MDVALVQHAEHDIDRDQRGQDQDRLALQRILEGAGAAGEVGLQRFGGADACHLMADAVGRLRQRYALGEVERDGGRGELALVVDPQRRAGRHDPRKGRQRHAVAGAGDDVDVLQRLRPLQVFLAQFHHHAILVQRMVDGGHQPLAERVVQDRIDLLHGDAQPRGGIPIDNDRCLQPLVVGVGIDVLQFLQVRQCVADLGLPRAQHLEVVGPQRELVLGTALPSPDADVLHRYKEQPRTRLLGELHAQPRDDLVGRFLALAQRLEGDEHLAGVALRAPGEAGDIDHGRVRLDDADEAVQLGAHGLERRGLVRADKPDQPAGVLLREEALGHDHIQPHVQRDGREQDHPHQLAVAQRHR
ncbi:hypothetical protein L602_002100000960 [Cupriavidus gilardii J11]|uniref:Uncharacterized protein n=1 Tax=Cupriavidus gilardii J11 TaxID=936133 RepID=A0A562BM44_9BURK|nr:hypothetical protein L602_002100000960 [Cupriavidus gilardii J11]